MSKRKNLRAMHPLYLDKRTLLLANRLARKNGWRHVDERELKRLSPRLKYLVVLAILQGDTVQVEIGVADDRHGTNYRTLRIDMKPEHLDLLPVGEAVIEAGEDEECDC